MSSLFNRPHRFTPLVIAALAGTAGCGKRDCSERHAEDAGIIPALLPSADERMPLVAPADEAKVVSLLDVLGNSRVWEGKRVRLRGTLDKDSTGLFLGIEHARKHRFTYGVALIGKECVQVPGSPFLEPGKPTMEGPTPEHLAFHYVDAEGIFTRRTRGDMGVYAASLCSVTKITDAEICDEDCEEETSGGDAGKKK